MPNYTGNPEIMKKLWQNPKYRQHMIEAHKGYKWTDEHKKNFIQAKTGFKHTEEAKQKMSIAVKGRKSDYCGEKHHWFGRIMTGKNHPRWISNRTKVLQKRLLRNSKEWKIWRAEIFERDRYTCKECGVSGVYLEAHHIIPIRSDMEKRFEITNGITLCRPCHIKTMWKESSFAEKYSALVVAH